jgi:hypothetical protein
VCAFFFLLSSVVGEWDITKIYSYLSRTGERGEPDSAVDQNYKPVNFSHLLERERENFAHFSSVQFTKEHKKGFKNWNQSAKVGRYSALRCAVCVTKWFNLMEFIKMHWLVSTALTTEKGREFFHLNENYTFCVRKKRRGEGKSGAYWNLFHWNLNIHSLSPSPLDMIKRHTFLWALLMHSTALQLINVFLCYLLCVFALFHFAWEQIFDACGMWKSSVNIWGERVMQWQWREREREREREEQ